MGGATFYPVIGFVEHHLREGDSGVRDNLGVVGQEVIAQGHRGAAHGVKIHQVPDLGIAAVVHRGGGHSHRSARVISVRSAAALASISTRLDMTSIHDAGGTPIIVRLMNTA
jgi:hypothetical protein